MFGAGQELIKTAENSLEVGLDGDPNVVADNGVVVHAAHEAACVDLAQELDLHDQLRFNVGGGDFLASRTGDESNQRAIVHRNGDVRAKLPHAVGTFLV